MNVALTFPQRNKESRSCLVLLALFTLLHSTRKWPSLASNANHLLINLSRLRQQKPKLLVKKKCLFHFLAYSFTIRFWIPVYTITVLYSLIECGGDRFVVTQEDSVTIINSTLLNIIIIIVLKTKDPYLVSLHTSTNIHLDTRMQTPNPSLLTPQPYFHKTHLLPSFFFLSSFGWSKI